MRRIGPIIGLWLAGLAPLSAQQEAPAPAVPRGAAPPDAGSPDAAPPAADLEAAAEAAERATLAAFARGVVEAQRRRHGIPGVVLAVVRDDRVLLLQGYGEAVRGDALPERAPGDAAARPGPGGTAPRAADAERSLFRIGSVSKTFTYTLAAQAIEQGVIALDDPVDRHLPEALRPPADGFGEPIRVRHLLTHTAGFEDIALGHLFEREPEAVLALEDYLVRHRPRRVRAPGAEAVYSNYGVALLGALLAAKAGMPFEDLVEQRLTGPLGMSRTTFREPRAPGRPGGLAPELAADLAAGHVREAGTVRRAEFEYIGHGAPSGSASATAADMARWMRLHLAEGALDGVRVLTPASAARMREVLFRNAPEAAGIAHGFLTERVGPYAAYGHGGATLQFHSAMVLVPERELGVFVAANADVARTPVREIARLLLEQLLALPRATPTVQPIDEAALARYAGTYRSTRRPYTTVEKLLLSPGGYAVVQAGPGAALTLTLGAEATRLLPVGEHLFQEADGDTRYAFRVEGDGPAQAFVGGFGAAVMERVGALDVPNTLVMGLLLAGLVALARVLRSLRREPRQTYPARSGLGGMKALAVLAALAWLAFLVLVAVAASALVRDGNGVIYSYPAPALVAALIGATVAAGFTALELVALVPVWRGSWQVWPKLRYTLAVAVFAATAALLWRWNALGLQL